MDGSTSGGSGLLSFLILFIVLALSGVIVYLYLTFRDHKSSMEADLKQAENKTSEVEKRISAESVNRLGNIKYVVNQVNDINDSIWKTYEAHSSSNVASINELKAANETMIRGVDTFFKFSTDSITNQRLVESTKLATTDRPKLDIIREVTLASGLTAKDLKPPSTTATGTQVQGVMAKFCATGGSPCISFPNADGETYLTALSAGKNIVLDAPVQVKKGLALNGTGTEAAEVQAPNGIFFKSHVGIGAKSEADSVLGVETTDTKVTNLIKAGQVSITRDGKVLLKNATGTAQATLEVDAAGKLIVKPPAAGMEVQGDINVTGQSKVGGQNVAVATVTSSTSASAPPATQ